MYLENIVGTKTILVKVNVLDKPGAPSGPIEFSEVTSTSLILKWNPPSASGGGLINNFVVEMRQTMGNDCDWKVISGSTPRTSMKVSKLITGMEYAFRIKAENRFGIGQALVSQPILAKYPFKVKMYNVIGSNLNY